MHPSSDNICNHIFFVETILKEWKKNMKMAVAQQAAEEIFLFDLMGMCSDQFSLFVWLMGAQVFD